MAKYLKKEEKKSAKRKIEIALLLVLALVLIVGLVLEGLQKKDNIPLLDLPAVTENTIPETVETQKNEQVQTETEAVQIVLSEELKILYVSDYAGMYMEDGNNEIVTDVMMILVENTSDKDLQLARIDLAYSDFTANFEITNLPAGEKLVALEKNRHAAVNQDIKTAELKNVVFFEKTMTTREDSLQFSGNSGLLEVKNISGADISEDIYIYYKYSAADLLYGGLTYRVVIEDGLAADETAQILSGHYSPENSRILSVEYGD